MVRCVCHSIAFILKVLSHSFVMIFSYSISSIIFSFIFSYLAPHGINAEYSDVIHRGICIFATIFHEQNVIFFNLVEKFFSASFGRKIQLQIPLAQFLFRIHSVICLNQITWVNPKIYSLNTTYAHPNMICLLTRWF